MNKTIEKKCVICGNSVLTDIYGQGRCFHCNWYNDVMDEENENEVIFPNKVSLNKAKKLYQEGKPFSPDLNDFMEMLYFYSEVEFWYKGLNCCVSLREDNKIEFGWSPNNVYYFANKNDFIKNAKIENEYVKDIWDKVENPKYI